MCGFCHAPEHAYEALLEHPEIGRSELCAEAQERLRIAAAPEPPEFEDIEYAWCEQTHQWIAWRTWGACATCGARTWRYATETSQHECARCQTEYVERSIQMQFFYRGLVSPDWEIERDWLANHPRQAASPVRFDWLRFSDYPVPNTRMFEGLPGPRYRRARPRILFGHAAIPTSARGPRKPQHAKSEGIQEL